MHANSTTVTASANRLPNIVILLVTIVICLLIAEIALRSFTPFPVGYSSHQAADADLGYRLSSDFPEADAAGFRNADGARIEVLALGDSHTYGNNVGTDASWPAVFAKTSGLQTYNAGVGSYGILAYHALLNSLCLPETRAAIIALYPANDFVAGGSNCLIINDLSDFWQQETKKLGLVWPKLEKECSDIEDLSIVDWLEANSAIVGAVRTATGGKRGLPADKPRYDFADGVQPMLVKRIAKHNRCTDPGNPDTAAMLTNLERMAPTWSRQDGVPVGVIILPSRERVVYGYFEKHGRLDELAPEFVAQMQNQIQLEKRSAQILAAADVPYREALPDILVAFEAELRVGRNFYPAWDDGHPMEAGYASYAAVALALLDEMGVDINKRVQLP